MTALAMVAVVGVLNYYSGHEVSLLLFYLVPIIQTAWFVGTEAGIVMALMCTATWYSVNFFRPTNDIPALVSFWNTTMRLGIFLIVAYIISIQSALKRSLAKEKELSRTDFLTGTLNPRAFSEVAETEIDRAGRYGHPFSIAYIDLDDFKRVNDRYGHTTGDQLLISVVDNIRSQIRTSDAFARLGGDEFALLFPETGDEAAAIIVGKISRMLAENMSGKGWQVTASIGLVTYETPPHSYDEMLSKADDIMYQVKQAGKNSFRQVAVG